MPMLQLRSDPARLVVLMGILGSGFAVEAGLMSLLQLYLAESTSLPLFISLATSLRYTGVLVGSVLWGRLFDVHRTSNLLTSLFLGAALTLGLLVTRPSVGATLCIALAASLVLSGLAPIASALGAGNPRSLARGRRVSMFSTARSVGMLIGGAAAGILLQSLSYAWTFALLASVSVIAVGVLLTVHLPPQTRRQSSKHAICGFVRSNLWGLYSGVMLRQMATAGGISMVLAYMLSLGISPATIGVVSASRFLFEVLTMYPFGALADRIGRRPVFLIGFGGSVVAPLFFSLSGSLAVLTIGFVIAGVGFGALYVGSIAHIGDCVPQERHGSMLGLFESVRSLGGILGPILAGTVVPVLGYRAMFLIMASTAALGGLLVGCCVRKTTAQGSRCSS
jgi:MFS family permease